VQNTQSVVFFVKENGKFYCKWAVQQVEGKPQACVQVFKVASDVYAGCKVGYLQRRLFVRTRDGGKKI